MKKTMALALAVLFALTCLSSAFAVEKTKAVEKAKTSKVMKAKKTESMPVGKKEMSSKKSEAAKAEAPKPVKRNFFQKVLHRLHRLFGGGKKTAAPENKTEKMKK